MRRCTAGRLSATARKALSRLQAKKSAWTRSDLIQYLGWSLPAERRAAASPALLAGWRIGAWLVSSGRWRAWRRRSSRGCLMICCRADGRSVYQPHGGTLYALAAQLDLEEQLVATAAAPGAPRLSAGQSAPLLGADACAAARRSARARALRCAARTRWGAV